MDITEKEFYSDGEDTVVNIGLTCVKGTVDTVLGPADMDKDPWNCFLVEGKILAAHYRPAEKQGLWSKVFPYDGGCQVGEVTVVIDYISGRP